MPGELPQIARTLEQPPELTPGPAAAPHPPEPALTRFAEGKSPQGEAALVVRHLLSQCPRCGKVIVKAAKLPW